jgi:anthranilate synthase/indole-3-glycerol phosphate synthase/phosphoribosylanthranilate isomerase
LWWIPIKFWKLAWLVSLHDVGADTVLLIVACLNDLELKQLLAYSRSVGMEPLVEVDSVEEKKRAIAAGAHVVGVNNRDLNTFQVDMNRTNTLSSLIHDDIVLLALSGITSRKDVQVYMDSGAKGVLVGEALMRSSDKTEFIHSLLGKPFESTPVHERPVHVKICGLTNAKDALFALECGADLLGFIFAESPRKVSMEDAVLIADAIRQVHPSAPLPRTDSIVEPPSSVYQYFTSPLPPKRPLLVGVFTNHSALEINTITDRVGLDLIQLHTPQPKWFHKLLNRPVIQVVGMKEGHSLEDIVHRAQACVGGAQYLLLDTETSEAVGGTGKVFNWQVVRDLRDKGIQVWMAGGLTPENAADALRYHPTVLDVSSGVEQSKGHKDHEKLKRFISSVHQ